MKSKRRRITIGRLDILFYFNRHEWRLWCSIIDYDDSVVLGFGPIEFEWWR